MPPLALMYHAVRPLRGDGGFLEQALVVDPGAFAAQIGYLAQRGYRSLTLDEYARARDDGGRAVLLTFDDGYEGLDEHVSPVLRRHGFTAVVFAPTAHLGASNTWDAANPALSAIPILSADGLRALARGPWEVASHSHRHLDLRTLDGDTCRRELERSRAELERILGAPPRAIAYPFGHADREVSAAAAAAGFDLGFVATPYPAGDPLRVPRRAITRLDRGPLLAARLARRPWVYELEDSLRNVPRAYRRVRAYGRSHRLAGGEEGG
jgi:peptidoglycan/xylan/chitin deacetylase (PgdA/CDA1 family)